MSYVSVSLSFLEESTTYNSSSVHNTLHSLKRDAYKSSSNMEWNNNLRNSSERQETSSAVAPSAPFYKKTAPDPPPKLATSLTNGQRHSKVCV